MVSRAPVVIIGLRPIPPNDKLSSLNSYYKVKNFKEKPDGETAQQYLDTGTNYWNAGIFLFKRDTMLTELSMHAGSIVEHCQKALAGGGKLLNRRYLDPKIFSKIKSMPIDIAVMEKTSNATVALANFGWMDIGSWETYSTLGEQDEAGNNISKPVILEDCHNNFIHSEGKLATAIGVNDLAIIDTADALLIMPKSRSSELAAVVKNMRSDGVTEAVSHRKVRRPWGSYEGVHHGQQHQVKHIIVKPGEKLSSQYHHYHAEHWIVVKGKGLITIGNEETEASENDSFYIPIGEVHRLGNPFSEDLHLIEVQFGTYLGEVDIVRLDDVYGRVGKTEQTDKVVGLDPEQTGETA